MSDRQIFRHTANKTRAINLRGCFGRGGRKL